MLGAASFAEAPFSGLVSAVVPPVVVVATVTGVLIAIGLTSPLVWGVIDDGQTPTWVVINNTQALAWSGIDTTQASGWVQINDTQTAGWSAIDDTQSSGWVKIPV